MYKISSFVASIALSSISSTVAAADPAVSFDAPMYNLGMPLSATGAGDPVCIQGDGLLVSNCDGAVGPPGPPGPGAGTFSKSIHAVTCVAQHGEMSGDSATCAGGGTLRTEGGTHFPCMVRGTDTLTTYVCHVDLPSGALIEQVTAYGGDSASEGYFEAAIWRTMNNSYGINYISPGFAGAWQNSGVADTPGLSVSFPIYQDSDLPHTVDADYKYTIGFATKAPVGQSVYMYGFRIDYTILP